MKNIAIAIIASFGLVTAFAQTTTEKPKTEMKLAKKKADKDKEDKTKKAKPATEAKK